MKINTMLLLLLDLLLNYKLRFLLRFWTYIQKNCYNKFPKTTHREALLNQNNLTFVQGSSAQMVAESRMHHRQQSQVFLLEQHLTMCMYSQDKRVFIFSTPLYPHYGYRASCEHLVWDGTTPWMGWRAVHSWAPFTHPFKLMGNLS